jgi:hypothetical protein
VASETVVLEDRNDVTSEIRDGLGGKRASLMQGAERHAGDEEGGQDEGAHASPLQCVKRNSVDVSTAQARSSN